MSRRPNACRCSPCASTMIASISRPISGTQSRPRAAASDDPIKVREYAPPAVRPGTQELHMLVQMELARIIISEINDQQIVFLKEVDGPRSFPIVIGMFEATSIDRRIQGNVPPRPLTHDLLKSTI